MGWIAAIIGPRVLEWALRRLELRVQRLFLLVALVGLVAPVGQYVHLRPRFVVGDEFTISMTRTVEERLGTEQTHSISRAIQIRVMAATASGTTLRWRPGQAQIKGVPERTDARMAVATLAAADHDFLLALDADGQYRRVTNVAELAPSLDRAREAMEPKFPAINDPELSALPKLTAAHVAQAVGLDAEVFTVFYGLSRPIGLAVEVTDTVAMPGGIVPAIRRFTIVSANDQSAEATMSLTVDQAAVRKLLTPAMESVGFKLDVTEHARYIFDRRVGLNRSGTMERTAISGPDRRIERWEFLLTSAPKR